METKQLLFSMNAENAKTIFLTNILVSLFVAAVLFFLLYARHIFSGYVYIIIFILIIFYQSADFAVWYFAGLRRIEITDETLLLYKGKKMKITAVRIEGFKKIDLFRKINRVIINIMLEDGQVHKEIPGVTLFSGKRIRVTNDRFDDKEFNMFIQKLNDIMSAKQAV